MTDSEKLDFIIAEMQGMKDEICGLKGDVQEIKRKVGRLEVGQSEIKAELIKLGRKNADTYNLALDVFEMSTENREWLETVKAGAPGA